MSDDLEAARNSTHIIIKWLVDEVDVLRAIAEDIADTSPANDLGECWFCGREGAYHEMGCPWARAHDAVTASVGHGESLPTPELRSSRSQRPSHPQSGAPDGVSGPGVGLAESSSHLEHPRSNLGSDRKLAEIKARLVRAKPDDWDARTFTLEATAPDREAFNWLMSAPDDEEWLIKRVEAVAAEVALLREVCDALGALENYSPDGPPADVIVVRLRNARAALAALTNGTEGPQ